MSATQSSSGAQGAKEQVQEKAHEAAGEARSRLREQVDQRSTQAGEQIGDGAQALRSTAEKLREEQRDGPARVADQIADRAEQAGSWLRDADADRILGDVESFARRQPLAVVGIGLFAGFAASRFLKASSRTRYDSTQSRMTQLPPRAYEPPPTPAATPSQRPPTTPGQYQEPPSVPSGIS